MTPQVAIVVLAAGGSTRMGRPKQLLRYRGRSLLRHSAEVAVASGCRPAVVVLGCGAAALEEELLGLPVTPVRNDDWGRGPGTSIRIGMRAIESADVEAVVFTLCDQPLTEPETVRRLITAYRGVEKSIVASEYAGVTGAPALFDRRHFSSLLDLPDLEGAKRLITRAGREVATAPFPGGAFDLDTPVDYERLTAAGGRDRSCRPVAADGAVGIGPTRGLTSESTNRWTTSDAN